MTFVERNSLLALAKHYAIDEFYNVLQDLPIYNDHDNGVWQDVGVWELFEPKRDTDGNYLMNKVRFHIATCSNCHSDITLDDYDSYCPRCGAKMNFEEE